MASWKQAGGIADDLVVGPSANGLPHTQTGIRNHSPNVIVNCSTESKEPAAKGSPTTWVRVLTHFIHKLPEYGKPPGRSKFAAFTAAKAASIKGPTPRKHVQSIQKC